MLRRCKEVCPFQIDCQRVRDELVRIRETTTEIEADLQQSLSVAWATHSVARDQGMDFSANEARDQIDEGSDLLVRVKEHRNEIADTERRAWVFKATSILATASCVGVVRGKCSSPVGRYIEHLEGQADTTPPPTHSESE